MFATVGHWVLAIILFILFILICGEVYSFYRDRRSSALFAAFSYLIVGIGFAFYFGTSLWLRFVIGPIVFLFAIIIYWVSFTARKEEHMPRPIFLTKPKKEKEAEKKAKLEKQRSADISATATIAAEKRAAATTKPGTISRQPGPTKGMGGASKPISRPGRK